MLTNIKFRWLLLVAFVVFYAITNPYEAGAVGSRLLGLVGHLASALGDLLSAFLS